MPNASGFDYIRGEGIIRKPPAEIFEFVSNPDNDPKWDPMCIVTKIIEELGTDFFISYSTFAIGWPFDNRDFVYANLITHKPDGEIMIVSSSVEHPAIPVLKGMVRGEILSCVMWFKPIPEGSYVIYSANMNPSGNIPRAITNKVNKSETMAVYRLRSYLEK
mmetsp:Transcript_25645/g.12136  ORF Transcript_25645/g.12136 Transcript_25645/m.12136 type:complete len:162 (-) Transcript_25645:80-565(-)|eukprot:CAMPEP_0201281022 /NCGR_PEP_ID=MMETSP1317-20130820/968_1 /ASSEMBLY_ACC=CAM_ASM_000770 /TAXON_ID=187299 /ORGANISM="Undescribed Undescribed, Strain Undescribed" /LENGTH=161 /DNA_ID=CAMNT_0047589801 /DNA_START=222 /DNA_END=707 /DNA_ORIENTATION=+